MHYAVFSLCLLVRMRVTDQPTLRLFKPNLLYGINGLNGTDQLKPTLFLSNTHFTAQKKTTLDFISISQAQNGTKSH